MKDEDKTKEQLISELKELRHRQNFDFIESINELNRSEAEKKAILDGITINIAFVNDKLEILWVNKTASKSVNRTSEEMLGHKCHEFWADPEKPCNNCPSLKAFKSKKTEHTLMYSPNLKVWDEKGEPVFDSEGNLIGVLAIAHDITERKQAEEKLRFFKKAVDSASDAIGIATPEGRHYYQNKSFSNLFGLSVKETNGETGPPSTIYNDEKVGLEVFETIMSGDTWIGEIEMLDKDKNKINIFLRAYPTKDKDDKVVGLVGVHTNITKRKQAEEKIKTSLEEKEILLQEVHHRVKNNLAMIISLIDMQTSRIKDKESLRLFTETKKRIYTMALIHTKLSKTEDFTKIEFEGFIQDLANSLISSYSIYHCKINLSIETNNIALKLDKAIPCGLIINELLTNALKYAFPEKQQGKIDISLDLGTDGKIILTLGDNGIGFPENIDFRKTESLGLRLVTGLTKQIDGSIDLDKSQGTTFKITFP